MGGLVKEPSRGLGFRRVGSRILDVAQASEIGEVHGYEARLRLGILWFVRRMLAFSQKPHLVETWRTTEDWFDGTTLAMKGAGAEARAEDALSMKDKRGEASAHQDKQNRQTHNKAQEACHCERHSNPVLGCPFDDFENQKCDICFFRVSRAHLSFVIAPRCSPYGPKAQCRRENPQSEPNPKQNTQNDRSVRMVFLDGIVIILPYGARACSDGDEYECLKLQQASNLAIHNIQMATQMVDRSACVLQ